MRVLSTILLQKGGLAVRDWFNRTELGDANGWIKNMVFTLHRYIFREIFRVFVLATVALTLMLSLGSILGPVAEYGVGPRQVVHLLGYFLPIMLTFVLPMAALFSTALVYGRLASDNELNACRASGVSLLTMIHPGLWLAIMVAIANLILSFYVMPAFVHRAERSLKADAKQILFRNIQRKGFYAMPPNEEHLLYADHADVQNSVLSGVIVAEIEGSGIKKITVAESAKINFYPHRRFYEVQITAYNTSQMGPVDQGGFQFEEMSLTTEFGSLLVDNIKFKKVDEIKEIELDLMRFYPVAKQARDVYAQLTAELLAEDIAAKISGDTESFYELYSSERFIKFAAHSCQVKRGQEIELAGDIVVIEYDTNRKPLRTLQCAQASLFLAGDELAPTLTMELKNAAWRRADGLEVLDRRAIFRGLILPQSVTNKFVSEDVLESVSSASVASALRNGPSPELVGMQNQLNKEIRDTRADIKAEMHCRLVFGIGCISMIMIGIGLGIILRSGHQLTAFAASCVPALLLLVCILAGKNMTKNLGTTQQISNSGIVLMWGGLALLTLLALVMLKP